MYLPYFSLGFEYIEETRGTALRKVVNNDKNAVSVWKYEYSTPCHRKSLQLLDYQCYDNYLQQTTHNQLPSNENNLSNCIL